MTQNADSVPQDEAAEPLPRFVFIEGVGVVRSSDIDRLPAQIDGSGVI